ncbi:TPA: holin-like murein hydrolase modulator CidA [Staphylococcus aureus]|nr:holin-like murein hydrolase modulator CidA [Staphylococcus aureus]MBV2451592.1 holin-like murein hydrolase modulator CidA [Staphylococcus aureus]MBV2453144.1 holin-like murein hydrolase modulator CidA [Staphylococcus aureus]MBV2455009.1 holin-like murein hydrolase modulator CidA [Staphylococcus aureus]MBV2457569.1 holin-like murein hydrolase modulator CidA [Staphylococcus aureus]
MHKVQLIIKLLLQLGIIIVITYIGTEIQKIFHLPLAGSIVGLFLFYLLLQFKIVPLTWVEDGAKFFLLKTMVFFFIPSVVGIMDVASEITLNYILFFAVIIIGTCIVALSSGYIAEKMSVKHKHRKGVDAYE